MRIIVYGLGAVGGGIAAALATVGHEVVGIARGAMAEALRERPLKVRMPGGEMEAAVPVVTQVSEIALRADDAVLLTMKSQDTLQALTDLRAAGLRDQPVFCFQNGVANEDMAVRYFPNVHGATVMMPVTYVTPGEVIASGAPRFGIFDIGRYPSASDGHDHALAAMLDGKHLAAFVTDDVMASKRGKLLMNLANPVSAILGPGPTRHPLADLAREEAEAVYSAAGLAWSDVGPNDPRRTSLMRVTEVPGSPRPGGSTAQSLLRRTGAVETDYLNGEIVRMGRSCGIETPVNAFFADIMAAMARFGFRPGVLDADGLSARYSAWRSGAPPLPMLP